MKILNKSAAIHVCCCCCFFRLKPKASFKRQAASTLLLLDEQQLQINFRRCNGQHSKSLLFASLRSTSLQLPFHSPFASYRPLEILAPSLEIYNKNRYHPLSENRPINYRSPPPPPIAFYRGQFENTSPGGGRFELNIEDTCRHSYRYVSKNR